MKRLILAALLLASCGKSGGAPDIQISDAWARETVAGQGSTAAYMTIANKGFGSDRLDSVDAPSPAMAMVHSTSNENGISRMRHMDDGLEVPAGGNAQLAPGGTHVMITGLGASLKAGDTLKLTLHFEKSGDRPVDLPIKSATVGQIACGPLPAAMSFTARRQSHGTLMARVVAAMRQTTPAPNRTL